MVDRVKCLVNDGVDINSRSLKGGYTPLICAAATGQVDVVSLLLSHNADTTITDNEGDDPLSSAMANDEFEVVALLRDYLQVVPRE